MKTITRLLATAALLFGVVGGVNSVKAKKVYGSISVATGCSWDAPTNTMSFTAVNGWQIFWTGLPSGDITAYTKFHATLSSMSDNIENIRLCIKDTDGTQAWLNLTTGENNVNLAAFATNNPDCDFTQIADVTLWSPSSSVSTVDDKHSASVVVTDVYMETSPKRTISRVQELTVEGSTFPATEYKIYSASKVPDLAFDINPFTKGDWERLVLDIAEPTTFADWLLCNRPTPYANGGWFDVIEVGKSGKVTLDLTNGSRDFGRICLQAGNPDGSRDIILAGAYLAKGSGNNEITQALEIPGGRVAQKATEAGAKAFELTNVNVQGYNNLVITFSSPTVGQWVVNCDGVETTIPEGTKEYELSVVGKETIGNVSLSVGEGTFPRYNNFEKVSLSYYEEVVMDALANDEIFSFDDATGYDPQTKLLTRGGWNFDNPVDLRNWMYLVITTSRDYNSDNAQIIITDNNGLSLTKDANKTTGKSFREMKFGGYENENAVVVDLYRLAEQGLDLEHIKSLQFCWYYYEGNNANVYMSNIYLTNYLANNMITPGTYDSYHVGDYERTYSEVGKYGTICLPYRASVSGAMVYSIAGKTNNGLTLERVDGLLEAGKPYFYMSNDEAGKRGTDPVVRNVQFFRADWTDDVPTPVENNGLIGTFTETTAPAGSNYYILSGNKLYNTEGCTGSDAVTVGANRAYIKIDDVPSAGLGSRSAFILFDEVTGIKAVQGNDVTAKQEGIFNINGQRLNQLKKGLNIVNGKKVMVK